MIYHFSDHPLYSIVGQLGAGLLLRADLRGSALSTAHPLLQAGAKEPKRSSKNRAKKGVPARIHPSAYSTEIPDFQALRDYATNLWRQDECGGRPINFADFHGWAAAARVLECAWITGRHFFDQPLESVAKGWPAST